MFLELTSAPSLSIFGGAPLAFAHVPWRLPLCECGDAMLANCVRRTTMRFITQWGPGFRFRLVMETWEEWRYTLLYGVPSIVPMPDGWAAVPADGRMLAQFLDLDDVAPPGPRGLTPIEQDAVAALQRIMRDFKDLHGVDPAQWTLADETARKNLARAAEQVGLKIVAPEEARLRLDAAARMDGFAAVERRHVAGHWRRHVADHWQLVPEYAALLRSEGNKEAAARVEQLAAEVASDPDHAIIMDAIADAELCPSCGCPRGRHFIGIDGDDTRNCPCGRCERPSDEATGWPS